MIDGIPCREPKTFINVRVDPITAAEWINNNYNNRPLDNNLIIQYAREMREGLWKANGETLKFDKNGKLIDGQHRLYSCVEAEVSFVTDIRCGLDREDVFDTIDTGKKRSPADILSLDGETSAHTLAAALNWAWKVDHGTVLGRSRPTGVEQRQYLSENPTIRESVKRCTNIRVTSGGLTSAMHYLFSRKDPKKASEFFDRLEDGIGLTADDPVYRLRERLNNNRNAKLKLKYEDLSALFIKSWNAYRSGKAMRGPVRWSREEGYPEIK